MRAKQPHHLIHLCMRATKSILSHHTAINACFLSVTTEAISQATSFYFLFLSMKYQSQKKRKVIQLLSAIQKWYNAANMV